MAIYQQLELLEAILDYKLLNQKGKLNAKLQKPQEIALASAPTVIPVPALIPASIPAVIPVQSQK